MHAESSCCFLQVRLWRTISHEVAETACAQWVAVPGARMRFRPSNTCPQVLDDDRCVICRTITYTACDPPEASVRTQRAVLTGSQACVRSLAYAGSHSDSAHPATRRNAWRAVTSATHR